MQSNAFKMSLRLGKGPLNEEEAPLVGMRGTEEAATPATILLSWEDLKWERKEKERDLHLALSCRSAAPEAARGERVEGWRAQGVMRMSEPGSDMISRADRCSHWKATEVGDWHLALLLTTPIRDESASTSASSSTPPWDSHYYSYRARRSR